MYENAEEELQRILKLVDSCPEPLRPKAFEILLQGFVESLKPRVHAGTPPTPKTVMPPLLTPEHDWNAGIPTEVLPRLKALAKRRHVQAEKLAGLFDFSADPFTYVPVHVEGSSANERTKKVALMVAGRSFLATGRWVADWAEIKAMCTHQSCYDVANFSAGLKKAKGDVFRSVDVGTSVELSALGTEQAEVLLAGLAGSPDAANE